MKIGLSAVLLFVAVGSLAAETPKLKNIKIRGYVTEVRSPSDFDIEDYRITRHSSFTLDLENADPAVRFQASDIRVGMEVEIRGAWNDLTGELKATSMKVDMQQFKALKQTAIIGHLPRGLTRTQDGWDGEIRVDGQRVVVSSATELVFKLTSRQKKQLKAKNRAPGADGEFSPLTSLEQISIGMAMTYEGRRRSDGSVDASRIELVDNDLEEGEGKLWKSLKVSSRPPQGFKPAEVSIAKVGKFKLLPDPGVQEYVAALGRILIPAYQRELPDGTPHKIPFQFFVIQNAAPNAFALPNGTIAVHSGMLLLLENEAQFAAVLGHEIAHAVQEHTWRQMQYHKKKRVGLAIASAVASAYGAYSVSDLLNLVEGAVHSGHSRSLENQADRVGLEYMVAAGYDPREAPKVWRLMAQEYGVRPTDFFWSSHENHATRRSYLMNELKNNHRDLDYGTTVRNEEDFRWVQARVRAANEGKLKVRVR